MLQISVYNIRDVIDKDSAPQHISVKLQETPTHIAVSCDQELLAVTGGHVLSVYRIIHFQDQVI